MKNMLVAGFAAALFAMNSVAQTGPEIQKDIQRHRAMAAAHTAAAECLAAGKAHDACQKDLQAACKGLGIGKHCGMRHEH